MTSVYAGRNVVTVAVLSSTRFPVRGDAATDFVVVCQIVEQAFKAADRRKVTAAKRQRGAQSEVQSLFKKSCAQNARHKVGADTERLQSRAKGRGSDGTIQTGHQSDRSVGQRRDHLAQVLPRDTNVAVIHQEDFVARRGQHLRQVADFDIGPQDPFTHDEFDRNRGIFFLQFAHNLDGGIGRIAHAEDELELVDSPARSGCRNFPRFRDRSHSAV